MDNHLFFLLNDTARLLAAGVLGLLVGALLAEGALLVPYWRTLSPQDFYNLHPTYAPRLFRFFAPLTIAGPSLALAAAVLATVMNDPGRWLSQASAALSLAIVGIYFAYFKHANAAFGNAAVPHGELAAELGRWAAWHTVRTAVGMAAFVCSLLALLAA